MFEKDNSIYIFKRLGCYGLSSTDQPVKTQAKNFLKFYFDNFFALKIEHFHERNYIKKNKEIKGSKS